MAPPKFGALAQLGERNTGSVEVSGSIPLGSTKYKPSSPKAWGFLFGRTVVSIELLKAVHKEHSDAERPHGQPPSLKKKGDKQRFESSRGGTLPQPDIIVTKPRIPNYTKLVNKLLNQVILACITFKRPY